jgi:hypothetical protein
MTGCRFRCILAEAGHDVATAPNSMAALDILAAPFLALTPPDMVG